MLELNSVVGEFIANYRGSCTHLLKTVRLLWAILQTFNSFRQLAFNEAFFHVDTFHKLPNVAQKGRLISHEEPVMGF